MRTIYGFHGFVPGLDMQDEFRLTLCWRKMWSEAGWNPVMLNEWQAMKHPYYAEFKAAVQALPTVNPENYEYFCYVRWLALAQVGGGFLSDTDVVPYVGLDAAINAALDHAGFPSKLHLFQGCAPCLVYASAETAEKVCRIFTGERLGEQQINDRPHCSDQYFLAAIPDGDLIQRHEIVKQYGDAGWETAPAVHYSLGSMAPAGKTPKWKWIPKLRK